MTSPFRKRGLNKQEELMYATNGTNFSIEFEEPKDKFTRKGILESGTKKATFVSNTAESSTSSMNSVAFAMASRTKVKTQTHDKSAQVQEFLRLESKGITSIASVASKPPAERDESEKQYFIMWLKLRMPFFADFDKRTLRVVVERFLCQDYKRNQVVTKFEKEADQMYVVIQGAVGEYDGTRWDCIEDNQEPDRKY